MELSLTTIFFLIVAFAVGAAVLLFMIGQWLDLTGLRYKMESSRNALNLLQMIASNSPLVERDAYQEPNKLILEETKLNGHEYPLYDMYDSSKLDDPLHKCCQFLDFDYKITVIDLVTPRTWNIGDIPFKIESDCYPNRQVGYADMPVVIHRIDGSYNPGVINITLVKTPLSDLSFWLSQSFIRASWDKSKELFGEEKSGVMTPVDPEIEKVTIDKGTGIVCMVFSAAPKRTVCKKFVTSDATLETNPTTINIGGGCYSVWIVTDIQNNMITVS